MAKRRAAGRRLGSGQPGAGGFFMAATSRFLPAIAGGEDRSTYVRNRRIGLSQAARPQKRRTFAGQQFGEPKQFFRLPRCFRQAAQRRSSGAVDTTVESSAARSSVQQSAGPGQIRMRDFL